MTKTYAIVGDSTLSLGGQPLNDLADGDNFAITFTGELSSTVVGKDGNAVIAKNEAGRVSEVAIRVILGSADDQRLNGYLTAWKADAVSFVLLSGMAVVRVGQGLGNVISERYRMDAGVPSKFLDAKSNVDGDTEQAIRIYTFRFSDAERLLG